MIRIKTSHQYPSALSLYKIFIAATPHGARATSTLTACFLLPLPAASDIFCQRTEVQQCRLAVARPPGKKHKSKSKTSPDPTDQATNNEHEIFHCGYLRLFLCSQFGWNGGLFSAVAAASAPCSSNSYFVHDDSNANPSCVLC